MLKLDTLGLAAKITASGVTAPDYPTVLERLRGYFRHIYGDDAYLEPDSKDGQMLAIYAMAIHDANNAFIDAYNAYSPSTATGAALSNNVAINGLSRHKTTKSTCDVEIIGQVGTVIKNGVVRDTQGYSWSLPDNVIIGTHGTITVTATCQTGGAITAASGDISEIGTPTRGWQSVRNHSVATQGRAVETDADLRIRQRKSVALPSRTVLDGVQGAISLIHGVSRLRGFENDTNQTDEYGIPPHSIAMIVDGGDASAIAQTIALKKGPGGGTFGDTVIKVPDRYQIVHPIRFSRPVDVDVYVEIHLTPFEGYTTLVADRIKTAIVNYIDSIRIGDSVYLTKLYLPANLPDGEEGKTYDIHEIKIGRSARSVTAANLKTKFNEAVTCKPDNIKLGVT
ncbi:baseplate J/gp47 family protein [Xenorhabdus sp. IM139775]|uniref:baseplate J/gp47 family protein n=1 Tax=Xenorhabdus sp. IM139775 TaxID=3025876 RepID=UPI002359AB9B|nr:baseplate J/gp47 family protein [Xenorhabdus sp. IM139775]MDC9593496.1 baseplate J/gp47 family protein [Xenorhabdus sp. IM139775]